MKNKIFITGATGMLASHLYNELQKKFNPILIHYKKENIKKKIIILNYQNISEIKKSIFKFNPKYIIHTAGITSVEECEKNKKNYTNKLSNNEKFN